MEIQFKKDDFKNIKYYPYFINNKHLLYDKIHITSIRGTHDVLVFQITNTIEIFTIIKDRNPDLQDFYFIFNTQQLLKIIDLLKSDTFSLENNTLREEDGSFYDLSFYLELNFKLDTILSFHKKIKEYEVGKATCLVKDLESLSKIKISLGQDKFDTYGIFDNWFVSSNRTHLTGAIKTSNNLETSMYIPSILEKIVSLLKLKEFKFNTDLNYLQYEDTYFFIKTKDIEYLLPNIMKDEFKEVYNFNNKLTINLKNFLGILNKFEVLNNKVKNAKIKFTFKENGLLIAENIEKNKAQERLLTSFNSKYVNQSFTLHQEYLKKVLMSYNSEKGDDIILSIPNTFKDSKLIVIHNVDNNYFFILNLITH